MVYTRLWRPLLTLALSLPATAPATAEGPTDRFAVRAEIRPQSRSPEGRFAIAADVRVTAEVKSTNGRYTLKATNVPAAGCDALVDLYANGFEGL